MSAFTARLLKLCPLLVLAAALPAAAQTRTDFSIAQFSRVTSARPLPAGIELRDGAMLMQITALRPDVIRIRATRDGVLPEDVSWAVLPEARSARTVVKPINDPRAAGFRTAQMQVLVDRATGLLRILDSHGNILREDAEPLEFRANGSFRITERMPADEHYFGLGDKTGPSDRRGRAFTMWNTDAYRFQESTDPLYKTIPFFLSVRAGHAIGTLLDNTWRSNFDFGKESASEYSFGAENGPCNIYIFAGPEPRDVVESYAWLTGKAPLPPKWILGFQQSRYTYTPASRLLDIANRLRADRIPTDALYLDIDFQDRNRPFTINTQTFPDMPGLLARLSAMHFHTVAITDLHIADAPGQNYAPFDSGTAGDHFLHRPDGSVYVGSVWPGPAVFPEFTQASTRTWWGSLYAPFVHMGFAGFWNDMNEPSIFNSKTSTIDADVLHRIDEPGFAKRVATHEEIHNVFGMENSRATFEGLLKLSPDTRPFVLTRASYAGGQRFAATWTGDDSSTWNHLRMATPMLKSLGLSGFSFAGADVGGFAGTSTPELLTRWLEVAAFQPIDRDHSEKGTGDQEPWVGGTPAEDTRRHFIETRYRLMPYLYTLAEETARTGMPMMRPLFLDFPHATSDGHAIDLDPGVDAAFLAGHDLLIAPSPYPEAPDAYTVEFPTARWYDFWTGLPVPAPVKSVPADPNAPASAADSVPLSTTVTPTLDTLPVYARGGAIIPMAPLTQSTDEAPQGPLTLRVYVGDDCRGALYDDDGKTFDYKRGAFLRMHFSCAATNDTLKIEISAHEGSYPAWWKNIRVEVYGWNNPASARTRNGTHIPAEPINNGVAFTLADDGRGDTLTLQ